jgi:L-fuculose-phosphate aldolase
MNVLEEHLIDQLKAVSLSMFRKNFLGIHHGSLSAKIQSDTFVINKADAIFDELANEDFIELRSQKNYRWNDASLDSDIHLNIYSNISEAKYVCYSMPPFVTSLSLKYKVLKPKDYFGSTILDELEVYDPKDFSTWYDRAKDEIHQYFRSSGKNIMIIKGYGIYTYNRDLQTLVKDIAILENSAKLLHYSN